MQRWGKSASSTALPASKRLRRSLVTLVLCVGLFLLYWYHWTPRVIARFLGLNSRSRGSEDGGVVRVSIGGPAGGGGGGGGATRGVVSSSGGMGGSEASLVWVLLGDTHYQPYLLESIRQARVFNPTELFFLVVEPRFWPSNHTWIKQLNKYRVIRVNYTVLEDPFTHDFSKNYQRLWDELGRLLGAMMQPTINGKSNLDFTSHTMVRVVAVHQLMAQLDLQRVVHIENDQMIYGSIQEVRGAADTCGVKLALTKLGARLSFATIYIRDAPSLKAMLDFILDAISHGTEHAIKVAESRWVTDMSLPAAYLATRATALDDTVTTFPPEQDGTCLAEQSRFIFDALPLGTWCCGDFNHPRAHLTHKMEESYVKYWEKPFEWRGVAEQAVAKGKPLRKPFWNGTRVFNLHMHSKQLHLFRSTDITMNMTAFAEGRLLAAKEESYQNLQKYHDERERGLVNDLARAKYELDIARSQVVVRNILGVLVDDLVAQCSDNHKALFKNKGTTGALEILLRHQPSPCPGLIVYLRTVAEDNGVSPAGVLECARLLNSNLSTPMHSGAPGGGPDIIAADALSTHNALLAFAALASFTSRHYAFYCRVEREMVAPKLRIPLGCSASRETLLRQPFASQHFLGSAPPPSGLAFDPHALFSGQASLGEPSVGVENIPNY